MDDQGKEKKGVLPTQVGKEEGEKNPLDGEPI